MILFQPNEPLGVLGRIYSLQNKGYGKKLD